RDLLGDAAPTVGPPDLLEGQDVDVELTARGDDVEGLVHPWAATPMNVERRDGHAAHWRPRLRERRRAGRAGGVGGTRRNFQDFSRPMGRTPASTGLRPSRVRAAFTVLRAQVPTGPGRAAAAAPLAVLSTSCGPQIGEVRSEGAALEARTRAAVAAANRSSSNA